LRPAGNPLTAPGLPEGGRLRGSLREAGVAAMGCWSMAADSQWSARDEGRWGRRALTVPAVLAAALGAFASTPVVLPVLVAADLSRARVRLPAARVWLVALQYLLIEAVEVLSAPVIWVVAKPGDMLGLRTSQRLSSAVAMWSARCLARRAESLLGVSVVIEGEPPDLPADRNLVVIARHASLLDAALPALVVSGVDQGQQHRQRQVCGVLMSELLVDPGFDIVYQRMGSVFVDRGDSIGARGAIRSMAEGMPSSAVAIIFCEGRLFSTERLAARLDRLREAEPARALRLEGLKAVLPPKAGGLSELLAGCPESDVVVLEHTGLESVPSVRDLLRHCPIEHPVRVRMRFFDRGSVPATEEALVEWLDDQYLEMDRWMAGAVPGQTAPDQTAPDQTAPSLSEPGASPVR
ncbi:MAG: 1-acyl-sn-glycerol-3-phosphate acyltransferase, partial [Microthrixaceae bacterium]